MKGCATNELVLVLLNEQFFFRAVKQKLRSGTESADSRGKCTATFLVLTFIFEARNLRRNYLPSYFSERSRQATRSFLFARNFLAKREIFPFHEAFASERGHKSGLDFSEVAREGSDRHGFGGGGSIVDFEELWTTQRPCTAFEADKIEELFRISPHVIVVPSSQRSGMVFRFRISD